jgi:hypothetical protein
VLGDVKRTEKKLERARLMAISTWWPDDGDVAWIATICDRRSDKKKGSRTPRRRRLPERRRGRRRNR